MAFSASKAVMSGRQYCRFLSFEPFHPPRGVLSPHVAPQYKLLSSAPFSGPPSWCSFACPAPAAAQRAGHSARQPPGRGCHLTRSAFFRCANGSVP